MPSWHIADELASTELRRLHNDSMPLLTRGRPSSQLPSVGDRFDHVVLFEPTLDFVGEEVFDRHNENSIHSGSTFPGQGRDPARRQGILWPGLFVRSLVGLDREAAKAALAGLLAGTIRGANQIEFANLVMNHGTEYGAMASSMLYEPPFTDLPPHGPDKLSSSAQVDELLRALEGVPAAARPHESG